MRPTGLRAVVVLAATSLVLGGAAVSSPLPAAPASAATALGTAPRSDSVTQRKQDLDKQIADLRDTLEGTSADLVTAAVNLKTAQTKLVDVRAQLAAAQAALARAEKRDAQIAADLAYAQAQEGKATKALDAQAQAEADARARLGRIARDAYSGSDLSGLSIALQASSPDQFAEQIAVAGAAMNSQSSEVDRLAVVQADLRAKTAKLTALRARSAELKALSEQVVLEKQQAQDDAAAAEAEQTRLVAEQSAALTVIQAKQGEEKARLAKAQQESDALAKILRDRAAKAARDRAAAERRRRANGGGSSSGSSGGSGGGSDGGVRNGGGYLSYPVNAPITSGFGMRFHPILHYWRLHAGTDFGAACGTPVHAAADGTIVRAGWAGGFGNQIVVDHGYVRGVDLASSYNHLSRIYVSGGRVSRGQVIGLSGTTGLSTGCHLHFEVYENGTHVNPMRWL